MARQPGFFDIEDRLNRLSDLGDQLESYSQAVDFEMLSVPIWSRPWPIRMVRRVDGLPMTPW